MSPEGQAGNAGAIRMQQAQCHRANGNAHSIVFTLSFLPLTTIPTIDYGAASKRTLLLREN